MISIQINIEILITVIATDSFIADLIPFQNLLSENDQLISFRDI